MCSVRTVQISVTDSAKFVQINVIEFSKIRAEQRDGFSKIRADQRDGSSKIRADQRDGFSKIPADQGEEFGFCSRRRTCKCREETGETKCANRRNRFLALTAVESDDDEEVNVIETVQEVVEITVGLERQERLAESKERCRENEVEEGGEIGGSERKSHSS